MSAVLKPGHASALFSAPTVFHMHDLAAEARQLIDQARRQAESILTDAREQSARILEQARRAGFEQGMQHGLGEGRTVGAREAETTAQARFDQDLRHLAEALGSALEGLADIRQTCVHEAESDLLDFALEIARRVTKVVAQTDARVAPANLQAALALVMSRSDLTVKAHPEDVATLQRFAGETAQNLNLPHIRFQEDPAQERGGVMVIMDDGTIDATLDGQLDQIARALGKVKVEA